MDTTRDLQLPSGSEVGAASLHPLLPRDAESSLTLPERSGVRGKLDTLKSRGLAKVHDIQRTIQERGTAVKDSLAGAQTSLRDGAKTRYSRMNESMKSSPMKWAGIAAASGFGIGLIGRMAHWRNKHRRVTPDLVIIESSC